MIEILEGDSSLVTVDASLMIMGYFDGGCGLPTLILVLLRALKYIDACLFLFPFSLGGVINAVRTTIASLANVLRDTSSCCSFSSSSAVFPVFDVSVFVYAVSGGVFSFSC